MCLSGTGRNTPNLTPYDIVIPSAILPDEASAHVTCSRHVLANLSCCLVFGECFGA